jgi:FlaA1/EpsC-like NDP-sugar epimerase
MQELQHSVQTGGSKTRIRSAVADVRFGERILAVFQELRPQIVFHAAAHKHVPLMEEHPGEAVTNNIFGTRDVVAAAQAVNVERFVMISTDKAVRPTSVMGSSKRVAELVVRRAALQSGRPYVVVRFGNVLGSRGSVVLTFKKQIERGGPVTVTDPEMCRFFMTIPEAVQLVLQAAALGASGEVFMLEMGDPVKIVDLARDLIQLSGLQIGRDIDIVYSGTRPGEKLYEELFLLDEQYTPTTHPRIFSAGNGNLALPDDLDEELSVLGQSAQRSDREAVLRGLRRLVPEYQPLGLLIAAATVPPEPHPLPNVASLAQPAGAGDD